MRGVPVRRRCRGCSRIRVVVMMVMVMFCHGGHGAERHAWGVSGCEGLEHRVSRRAERGGVRMHGHLRSSGPGRVPGEIWCVAVQAFRFHELMSGGRFAHVHHGHGLSTCQEAIVQARKVIAL